MRLKSGASRSATSARRRDVFAVLKTPRTEKITKWLTSNGKDQDGLEKFGLEFGC